jgi:hypothetical protein
VGQGWVGGQKHAFLMTVQGNQVPEPSTLLFFGLTSAVWALRAAGFPSHPSRIEA